MATLKDVANLVGVSVATVSYVLTGRGSVSDEVRKKVLEAVDTLGYRPNRKAQAMRTGISKSIGLIIPDLTNPYFPELAQKIESKARRSGYSVIMVDCQNHVENEREGLQLMEQHTVDGLIWCPTGNESIARLSAMDCPVVLIDRREPGFDTVSCDYHRGGQMLANYIYQQGHQRIGLLSGPQTTDSARERRQGFLDALQGCIELAWEAEVDFSTELNTEAKALLEGNSVSLVVAANDLIAIGAISVLKEYGIDVPGDVSVVGFDNIPWSALITPKLTTISQPVAAIAEKAVETLLSKIAQPDLPENSFVLDVNLVERDSVSRWSAQYSPQQLIAEE